MKRKFTANILFLIGINLLIKPFYALAIDTSVQNIVGPEAYGLFLAIFNFVYIQQIFADLGIQNYNNRFISRSPEKLSNIFPKILGAKLIFTLAFAIIVVCTSWIFGYIEYLKDILIWVIGSQAMLSMLLYLRTNISGSGRYFADSFISVLDKLILIIWMSYVLWVNPDLVEITISYFVKVQFVSLTVVVLFLFIYTHQSLTRLRVNFDFTFLTELSRKTLPYASLVILMAGYSRLDGIMLEQLLNDNAREAGEYAQSFRLYDTFNSFTFLFASLLLPMFSRMIKQKESVNELVLWAFRLLVLISVFVSLTVYWDGSKILGIFYNVVSEGSEWTLFYLMIAGVSLSLNYIYGTLLTANGDIRILNYIALVGFSLAVLLNFIAIPKYGKEGAAMTTLVTQTLVLFLQMYYCYRAFPLKGLASAVYKVVIIGVFSSVLFYLTETLTYQIPILLKIFSIGILYLGLAFLIRLVRLSDMKMT